MKFIKLISQFTDGDQRIMIVEHDQIAGMQNVQSVLLSLK